MNKVISILGAGVAGAALMYFLDPSSGKRRRAVVADKSEQLSRTVGRGVGIAARDIGHRAQGVVAKGRQVFRREVTDDVLVERIRAELGRLSGNPSEIHVEASDGYVTLTGPVLEREIPSLIKRIGKVRGVRAVVDRLSPELSVSDMGSEETGAREFRGYWHPAKRACAIAAGLSAMVFAGARRNRNSMILGTAGAALLARGVWNGGRKAASRYSEESRRQAS